MVNKLTWSAAARICAGVLLLWALSRHPYGYYKFLRWVVCGVGAYSAFEAAELKQEGWAITFGIMALIFNPFVLLRFDRATWVWLISGRQFYWPYPFLAFAGRKYECEKVSPGDWALDFDNWRPRCWLAAVSSPRKRPGESEATQAKD